MDNDNTIEVTPIQEDEEFEMVPETRWDKVCNWIADHKIVVICSVIGLPILAFVLGCKLLSKTTEVEVQPEPGLMDRYDAIPVRTMSTTEYEYQLKPEFLNKEE